jgi:type II secretory pathway pseudopilin PulG
LTLVELLVVLAILVFLAVLGYALVPSMYSKQRRVSAVDQLTIWLMTARQRAKRDMEPTGLRLLPVTDDQGKVVIQPDGSVFVRQLQYVQQPEPLTGGVVTKDGPSGGQCESIRQGVVTFRQVDFVGAGSTIDEYLVQPGDYLELRGGGNVYVIAGVERDRLYLSDSTINDAEFVPTTQYRIIRQPRPLLGEKTLEVPGDTVIDLGPPSATDLASGQPLSFLSPTPTRSVKVPERLIGGGTTPRQLVLEVVFSPSGAVLGSQSGKVILWLRDATAIPPDLGSPSLLAIPISTGFIAAHDVAPGANPYRYTESGRGSGL